MVEQTKVEPGQVWADNDPRAEGRTIRVESITPEARGRGGRLVRPAVAVCTVLSDRIPEAPIRSQVGRRCNVQVKRFRPVRNGYRLITETPPAPESSHA